MRCRDVGRVHDVLDEIIVSVRQMSIVPRCCDDILRIDRLVLLVRQFHHGDVRQFRFQDGVGTVVAPNPKQAAHHLGRERPAFRFRIRLDLGQFVRLLQSLRHRHHLTLAVESPGVITAKQRPVVFDPPLGQRNLPMRTFVLEGPPNSGQFDRALGTVLDGTEGPDAVFDRGGGVAVVPNDQIDAEQREFVRFGGIEVLDGGQGMPASEPVEFIIFHLPLVVRPHFLNGCHITWSAPRFNRGGGAGREQRAENSGGRNRRW
mmetsp:Transcript_9538/g.20185  ORF Transcript_9538/g.20185 Transcript_9538/m.20185 type:complete len:261 (+) Transcript_9538:928-1710(+)